MTDRELLELAAKAAGVYLEWDGTPTEWQPIFYQGKTYHSWNPLTDDGDALRLAVKLHLEIISVYFYGSKQCQRPTTVRRSGGCMTEDFIVSFPTYTESFEQYDPYAATRRAIVRAAAEIGKDMK